MATSIGRLVLDMAADAAGFERDMSRISKSAKKELNQVSRQLHFAERDLEKARSRVNRLSAAIAGIGAAGIAIAGREFRKFAQEADNLDKVSKVVALTVEELQELRFAAEQAAGVAESTMDMAMQRFTRRIGEAANGTGELLGTIERLGISIRDSEGNLKNQTVLLGEFADHMKVAASDQEALSIAMKAFDSEGAKMVALMRQGSGAIEELREQFRQTGAGLSTETVKAVVDFNDSLRVLSLRIEALKVEVFSGLIEPLSEYARFLATTEQGQEVFRAGLERVAQTAQVVGTIIGVGFVAALSKAIASMLVAEVRVASLTRQKLILSGATRGAATSVALFGRALSIATGPIGIAAAVIGTLFFSMRDLEVASTDAEAAINRVTGSIKGMERAALNADIRTLERKLRELWAAAADAEFGTLLSGPDPEAAAQIESEIDRILNALKLAKRQLLQIEEGIGGFGSSQVDAIQTALEMIRQRLRSMPSASSEFEASLDELAAKLKGPVAEAHQEHAAKLAEAREKLDEGTISQKQFNRAQALYRKELEQSIDKTDEYTEQLENMEATLGGELAEATLEYSRQIQEYLEALDDGAIDQELFNKLLEAARRQFERAKLTTRSLTQEFAELESELEIAAAKAGMTTEEVEHLERELFILEKTTALVTAAQEAGVEVTDDMIAGYREMAGAAFDAANAQDQFSRTLAQSLVTAISAADGRSLGESLGASLRAYGTEEIQEGIQDALSRAMEAIGVDAENQGSAIAVASLAIGQAVGGQMGAAIGTALGAAIGSVIPGIGTALGAAIGGLIGGLFDGGSVPKFQVRGPDADRAISEGTDFVRSTALVEELQFAFRELNAEVQREVEQAFLGFDRAMAGIIRDAGQLEEIEEALREFAVSSRSDGEDLETLLQMRFDAIMGTFDEAIQAVVEQGLTLEEQVQRLAEVLAIEREMDFGRGLGLDGLESTLDALMALEIPGEQLGETFVRIRDAVADLDTALAMTGATIGQTRLETLEFAAGLTEAFGNTERLASVWDTIFETFYSEGERAAAEAGQARNVAETLLDQLGIELTDELATESGFRELLDELMPTLDPEDLAILLEAGEAIARLIDAEDRLADTRGDSLSELDQFMAGIEDSILEIMSPNRLGLQQLRQAQDEQMEQAAALGASEMQLLRVRQLHELQTMQFIASLEASIQSLTESLFGADGPDQQFQDLGTTVANTANQIRDSFIAALESIEDWIDASQLGSNSPLTPAEQLNEAQAQFDAALAAALGGDVDAMGDLPGLADALIGQASGFFGTSTDDFQAIWDAVQAAMGQVADLEPPPEQQEPTFAQQQQIADSTQGTAQNTFEQLQQAAQLLDEIGMLADLTGQAPSEIGAEFGIPIDELISILTGQVPDLTGDALEGFFDELVAESQSQLSELAELESLTGMQVDTTERIRDLAEDQLNAAHQIRDILQGIASGELEQFAEGGPVTATGPALVHAGEFVVPQGGALVQSGSGNQALLDEVKRLAHLAHQGNEDRRLGIRTTRDGLMANNQTTADLKREIARNRLHSGASRRKPALT